MQLLDPFRAVKMCVSRFSQLLYALRLKICSGNKSLAAKYCLDIYCSVPLLSLLLFSLFPDGICDGISVDSVPLGFEVNASGGDKNWVSKNGVFAFGFLEINDDGVDEYVAGIRYNLPGKSANFPVWTLGGSLKVPVNSTFRLAKDGRLVLTDPSGITVWSSNTSNVGVEKASLLNNGNLVLLNSNNEALWESFSSPTNTLLPGQSLRSPQNLRASSTRLVSSYYNLVISQAGQLVLVWEHNVTYWKSAFNSSSSPHTIKEALFESNGVFGLRDDCNNIVWSVSAKDYTDAAVTLRHLRIDRDGNLRIYSWDAVSHTWKAVWQALQDQCQVFGYCGLYSVCGYNSSGPMCQCLSSGSLSSSSSANSDGPGCKRMVDLGNCQMHAGMLAMKQTVLYGLYPPHDVEMSLSESVCKDYCLNDSTCIAATSRNDGSGVCAIKRTSFVSGYKTPFVPSVSFLKVCSVPQAVAAEGTSTHGTTESISSNGLTARKGSKKRFIGAMILVILLTSSMILSIQILLFWLLYLRQKLKLRTMIPFGKDGKTNPRCSALIRLSFEEVKELTNNFANQIGPCVFRGMLSNKSSLVAKVLKDVVVSEKEFLVTVSTLSGTHHRNLVSVKGFCLELGHKVLLYEFVPNGSLDKWLFSAKEKHGAQIQRRKFDIALGIARALAYLHTECHKRITHGNLKLENVLLDENLVPKLTDFGLQDLLTKRAFSSSQSPSEQDIYMLGLMFLQIITCKKKILQENMQELLDTVNQGEKMLVGADRDMEAIERIIRISFWCMQNQPFLRPSIGEVVRVLEGTLSVDRPPSHLGLRHHSIVETEIATEIVEEEF